MSFERQDRTAVYALTVLTFINLFNYVDRWVVAAVVESIKRSELHLTDTQLGLVGTGFIFVYTLTSPFFGTLGDRKRRPPLIAIGVALWSIATALAGFARGFMSLFVARSAVGIGEAAYGTIAPALLADTFPLNRRGRILSIFFCAIPVGSAAGYVLGGFVNQHWGWRAAFWIAGAPGLLLALLVLFVRDPPRGIHDAAPTGPARAGLATYLGLLRNAPYMLTVLGYGAYTFALGGLAFWMPAFLERERGMTGVQATQTFGAIALITGLVGTFSGGWLGDFFLRKSKQSYLWVSGIATLAAAPITYIALSDPRRAVFLPAIVIAEILIFMSTGPVNSAIINAVAPAERATALGMSVFVMHFLGDIPSPPLIGKISDTTSLEHAFLIIPVAIIIAGSIWMYAAWRGPK
ncbi:MAG: MFS transporter [Acidobacteriota bacterium]|nr:MFS transporter [Acidobacteriota bacterium]